MFSSLNSVKPNGNWFHPKTARPTGKTISGIHTSFMTGQNNIGKWIVRAGLVAILAVPVSCGKTETIDLNPNLNVANDIVISQRLVLNAFRLLVRAVNDTDLLLTHHTYFDGASVTYTPGLKKYAF